MVIIPKRRPLEERQKKPMSIIWRSQGQGKRGGETPLMDVCLHYLDYGENMRPHQPIRCEQTTRRTYARG
jgi:hypothetical protein